MEDNQEQEMEMEYKRRTDLIPQLHEERRKGYKYALAFWQKYFGVSLFDTVNLDHDEFLKLPLEERIFHKDILTIEPLGDIEREMRNLWYKEQFPNYYPKIDLEKVKQDYFKIMQNSPNPKEYLEKTLKEVEVYINSYYEPKSNRRKWAEFDAYYYEGSEPDWKTASSLTVEEFVKAKFYIDYRKFLQEQLKEMEVNSKLNAKDEVVEVLDKTAHKIVLLHEIGVIDFLEKRYSYLSKADFAKLICNVIGMEKKITTVTKTLRYLGHKDQRNPINDKSLREVQALLSSFGIVR